MKLIPFKKFGLSEAKAAGKVTSFPVEEGQDPAEVVKLGASELGMKVSEWTFVAVASGVDPQKFSTKATILHPRHVRYPRGVCYAKVP